MFLGAHSMLLTQFTKINVNIFTKKNSNPPAVNGFSKKSDNKLIEILYE